MSEYLYKLPLTRLGMLTEGPTPEEAATVAEHFAYLEELTEQEVMVLVGRTQTADEDAFGIAIFRVDSDEAARAIMAADPAVARGVMTAKLYPYRIALMARSQ